MNHAVADGLLHRVIGRKVAAERCAQGRRQHQHASMFARAVVVQAAKRLAGCGRALGGCEQVGRVAAAGQQGFAGTCTAQQGVHACCLGVVAVVTGAEQGNFRGRQLVPIGMVGNQRHGLKRFECRPREHGRRGVASPSQKLAIGIGDRHRATVDQLGVATPVNHCDGCVGWQSMVNTVGQVNLHGGSGRKKDGLLRWA